MWWKFAKHCIAIYYFDCDMFNSSGSQNMCFSILKHIFYFFEAFMCWMTQVWKKTCACSQRDLPCGEWHSLHFPKCVISCPLFHDPFEMLCVPAPDQQGVPGTCVTTAIQIAHLNDSLLNAFQEQLTILMNITISSALLRNYTFTNHENDYTCGLQGVSRARQLQWVNRQEFIAKPCQHGCLLSLQLSISLILWCFHISDWKLRFSTAAFQQWHFRSLIMGKEA